MILSSASVDSSSTWKGEAAAADNARAPTETVFLDERSRLSNISTRCKKVAAEEDTKIRGITKK